MFWCLKKNETTECFHYFRGKYFSGIQNFSEAYPENFKTFPNFFKKSERQITMTSQPFRYDFLWKQLNGKLYTKFMVFCLYTISIFGSFWTLINFTENPNQTYLWHFGFIQTSWTIFSWLFFTIKLAFRAIIHRALN